MSGFVYLIGTPIFGWYKIGKSCTPEIRVKNLGVLLPFKIEVLAVWRAENHHAMEIALHDIYSENRINGEWFEFSKDQIRSLIEKIPAESVVEQLSLDKFSNIEQDTRKNGRVLGVRVQKLRGNFTPEEREEKRRAAIEKQRLKKQQ